MASKGRSKKGGEEQKTGRSARKRPRAVFTDHFLDDLRWWAQEKPPTAIRVLELVEAILREPTTGIGKPERLRHWIGNVWSRRISEEHRLVYEVEGPQVRFLQARYHYD